MREVARHLYLKVLIWGPGEPGENSDDNAKAGYEKRCKIRETLKENFPNATVEFSEDLIEPDSIDGPLDQEARHARIAHLVIILDISRGADLELDYFSKYPWFREKVWLLVPQKYLDSPGLADEVYKLIPERQRQGFTSEEFDRSDVAKVMSVKIVAHVAMDKLLKGY